MHYRRNAALSPTSLLCCALSYALLLSGLSPFCPRGAAAAAGVARNAAPIAARRGADAPRREGEVIVRFRDGVAEDAKGALLSSRGGRRKAKLRGASGLERIEIGQGQDPAAAAEALRLDPAVEFAEPNFLIARSQATPNDARFGEQWALRNTGQAGGAEGADVRAAAAWQETTGAPSTVVAVIDSGVDFTHPDLSNQQWRNRSEQAGNNADDDGNGYADDALGWDWVTDSGAVRDEQGHGTAVAGVIAAEGNNSFGTAGVMWRASLMSLRVLDAMGTGDVAAAVEAIDYAAAHGAAVVNCSWGTEADSRALRDAVERAGRRGVLVVASAGNSARDIDATPYYPASFDLPNLVSVASTDQSDNLAPFSNRGAARVGVAAPGVGVLTTGVGGDYAAVTGTSVSAPLVAGIAGLLKTLRPNMPAALVRDAIISGSRRVASLEGKVASGGVADAAGAIGALRGNPYGGNGDGGGDGNGNGNGNGNNGGGNGQGNGQGNGRPYVPPGRGGDGSRGRDTKGLLVTPPKEVRGAPAANLPNLDESRKRRTSPVASSPSLSIQSNLPCADCDPSGGGGGGGSDPYFGTARTRPDNDTGDPGVTLGSRNFNWSLPLVGLRGRAGLDLSLTLYYNSLVWTRQGTSIQYNADHGTPAPGFQLGLPRLQNSYFDSDEGANAYVMITPSGGRVQMNQVGAALYESSDGTFTQLTIEGTTPVVRTTDGTQYRFATQVAGERRCTEIKDRNGNFITATYNASNGHLLTVTDTTGRVVTFVYYADHNLQKITQTWGGATHTYATFYYGPLPMSPNFAENIAVYGLPANGAPQTVLAYVELSNHETYHFHYNTYGQVNQISHNAPDGYGLEHTAYTFDLSTPQTDCPRFTQRRDFAKEWNGEAEAVTHYSVTTGATWTNPETGAAESGTLAQQTTPDGTVYKEYSHASGWDAGLPRLSEVWATVNGVSARRKWTSTAWEQDDPTLPHAKNPRLVETNVYDEGGNRRRTSLHYHAAYIAYNLPWFVAEYAADGVTAVRHTVTDYNLDAAYTDRRIIGLVSQRVVYDGAWAMQARTVYTYDAPWEGYMAATPGPATQHDAAGYGAGFRVGRGNLMWVARFDVTDAGNWNKTVNRGLAYNQTGSVIFTHDTFWHQTSFDYADSFSDGNNARNTYAYPTKVTDPEGNYSTAQYNYDHGGVTLTYTPTSGTGAEVTWVGEAVQYDAGGRVERVTNQTSGAYKRWVYDDNGYYVHAYETIMDTSVANEFHSWVVMDGAGRVRATASDHPDSQGGFSAVHMVYDQMGRLYQQSKPTEMTGAWAAAGDDSAWVYTNFLYDWRGRTSQVTNADGSTRVFTYGGCGCAGGEVVTAQDEHGRQRRLTKDVLGRLAKVEEMNWGGTVYSTTDYTHNTRDQITEVNQQGQTRSFVYDGLGRLQTRTTPEQGETTYTYNRDDQLTAVTDARGASKTFGYDARHLPTSVTYGVPSGVASTPDVSFTYDAAGNRTSMTDGHGYASYHYDSLGRMDAESRTIAELGPQATYYLYYGYNVAGQLTSVTNHWGAQVFYDYDTAGRVTAVNGANYANVPNYVNNIKYRAFGALKGMNFANGRTLSASYDDRMQPIQWNVAGVLGYNYGYGDFNERTGRVTYAQSVTDATLDRSYEYDQVGRLVIAHAGAEARAHTGQGAWGTMDGPYSLGYEYDRWGNQTKRYGWGGILGGAPGSDNEQAATFTGNRRDGFTYDASGNLADDLGQQFTYDAEGRQATAAYAGYSLEQAYDGDRLRVKKVEQGETTYYLRSSVLGGSVVAEMRYVLYHGWGWARGYVYLGSQLLATQQSGVFFAHEDPVTKSKRVTDMAGNSSALAAVELDPFGADTSRSANAAFQPRRFTSYERDGNESDEAMHRRYNRWHSRFDQPDPYDGSYDPADPQSFNRYAYVQNDPVNFIDPSGLNRPGPNTIYGPCPPGSARCSDEFAGGYPLLPGFNEFTTYGYLIVGHSDGRPVGVPVSVTFIFHVFGGQDPFRRFGNEEYEDFRERVRKAQKTNQQAWMNYADCLSKNPAVIEYGRALTAANVRASLPIPGALAVGKVSGRRAGGAALISSANVFTLAVSGMINLLIANPSAEVRPLLEKLQPVKEDCMNQTREKYGFTPVSPYR